MAYDALMNNLEQAYKTQLLLKTIAEQKREAIVHNHLEEINRMVQLEGKLVGQLDQLETERIHLAEEYMRQNGFMPAGQIKLSTLIGVTHHAERKLQLMLMHSKLSAIVDELRTMNELNQQLIQQSLSYLQFHLDLLIDDGNEGLTYQNPAAPLAKQGYSSFDAKI